MRPKLAAPLLLAILALGGPLRAQPALIEQAAAAYGIHDVNRAESLYRAAAADTAAAPRERAIARRELARIAWLVDGEAEAAIAMLSASLAEDPDPCPAAFLQARILNDEAVRRVAAPGIDALAVRCLAIEPGVATERVGALVRAAADLPPTARADALALALAAWNALPSDVRTGPAASRLQLSLGLLGADSGNALEGWRNYFALAAPETLPQALRREGRDGTRLFREGLARDAPIEARLALADLLMRAGFEEDLRRFVADRRLLEGEADEPRRRAIAAYLDLVDDLHAEILAHDRRYARRGAGDEDAYEARLLERLRTAAAAAGETAEDPWPALRRRFNLYGVIGRTNGVASLHLGHVVVDERLEVEQGERRGSIGFIAIDNMVHNSFSGWLADGASGPGGWAADGTTIVQVRPRYLVTVENALALARPGEARDRFLQAIEIKRESDRAIARAAPISFLPGVRDRLRLAGIDDIAARVRARVGDGAEFAPAFRRAFSDAVIGSSIGAHEGRHVLDQLQFTGDDALLNEELEYRAKLSEIALAESPRLALSSIFSPLFGGSTGHGIANRRLAGELAGWIATHPQEVSGHDPSLTPLEQLDRLTNDQLRVIVHGLEAVLRQPS